MIDLLDTLRQLTETPGPSGFEERVAAVIADLWRPLVDEITIDRVGSLSALVRGSGVEPRPRILLAAHLDEIGLMVSEIRDYRGSGFLRVTEVGGVDLRQLLCQAVVVHGERDLHGVIGALPDVMLPPEGRDKPYQFEDLVVDTGLPVEELREIVHVGDFVSFRQNMRELQGRLVTAKALDNRASVAAVTLCLDYLAVRQHTWDVAAVATAQEETRLLGAYTSAFSRQPDLAIAVDVTFGKGAGVNDPGTFDLGSGPVLDIGPNVHPGVYRALREAADAVEIQVSTGIHARSSGTDAIGLQVAREGIPTGVVSIPIRYMHTMVETVDLTDIERTGRLLAEFIARLNGTFIQQLAEGLM
jgi:endoglucanase